MKCLKMKVGLIDSLFLVDEILNSFESPASAACIAADANRCAAKASPRAMAIFFRKRIHTSPNLTSWTSSKSLRTTRTHQRRRVKCRASHRASDWRHARAKSSRACSPTRPCRAGVQFALRGTVWESEAPGRWWTQGLVVRNAWDMNGTHFERGETDQYRLAENEKIARMADSLST